MNLPTGQSGITPAPQDQQPTPSSTPAAASPAPVQTAQPAAPVPVAPAAPVPAPVTREEYESLKNQFAQQQVAAQAREQAYAQMLAAQAQAQVAPQVTEEALVSEALRRSGLKETPENVMQARTFLRAEQVSRENAELRQRFAQMEAQAHAERARNYTLSQISAADIPAQVSPEARNYLIDQMAHAQLQGYSLAQAKEYVLGPWRQTFNSLVAPPPAPIPTPPSPATQAALAVLGTKGGHLPPAPNGAASAPGGRPFLNKLFRE